MPACPRVNPQSRLDARNSAFRPLGLTAAVGIHGINTGDIVLATGTVKWFNAQKGFGFIQPDDGSKDVFVHISAVERAGMGTLNEGQKLNYEVARDRGKDAAANLTAAS
jgi:CspA family cold shock protein